MSTTQAIPNTHTFKDLLATAIKLGEEAGRGKDTQIKALLALSESSYHGAIDLDKNKHGAGVDDVFKFTEAYVKAQSGATVFDHKAPNQRVQMSKFRTAARVGQWTKGGSGEPLGSINNLMSMWRKFRADPSKAKKLDDAANTFLKYARVQLRRDQLIGDDELRSLCFKKDPELKTAEELVEEYRDKLTALAQGKAASGTALDNSTEVQQAIDLLTKRLKDVAMAKRSGPMALAAFGPEA